MRAFIFCSYLVFIASYSLTSQIDPLLFAEQLDAGNASITHLQYTATQIYLDEGIPDSLSLLVVLERDTSDQLGARMEVRLPDLGGASLYKDGQYYWINLNDSLITHYDLEGANNFSPLLGSPFGDFIRPEIFGKSSYHKIFSDSLITAIEYIQEQPEKTTTIKLVYSPTDYYRSRTVIYRFGTNPILPLSISTVVQSHDLDVTESITLFSEITTKKQPSEVTVYLDNSGFIRQEAGSDSSVPQLMKGDVLPNFDLVLEKADIASVADNYYVVDFWYLACGPCHKIAPEMQHLYSSKLSDVKVVGINLFDEEKGTGKYLSEKGYDYPNAYCKSMRKEFPITSFPTVLIVNHAGEVTEVFRGYTKDIKQRILLAIEKDKRAKRSPEALLSSYRFSSQPIDSLVVDAILPELEAEYGGQKICAEKYRDKFLAALSFYPELKDVEIRVLSKTIKTSMAVRPWRFHWARRNRSYTIYVDDISEGKPVDFRKATYSAQVGCFAHELAHIVYYEARSNVTLVRSGFGYVLSQQFRSKFEKEADNITIRHGAGFYIYQFATFVLEKAPISEEYREFKEENYYDNDEILALHKKEAKDRRKKRQKKLEDESVLTEE